MTISAVLTPCSARKRKLSSAPLEPAHLKAARQDQVAKDWLSRLATASGEVAARDLYQGASFTRIRQVADAHRCPLYVVSAGLGLLEGTSRVPAYDLTLSPSAPSRIQSHIVGQFDPAVWWTQMQGGRFAASLDGLCTGSGRILVALTKPYAQLIGAALAQLPASVIARLRIFGASFDKSLPASLRSQVMPYDDRLDVLMPGTRLDFASRALAHFATLVGSRALRSASEDAALIRAALATTAHPVSPTRPKASDEELLGHIKTLVQRGLPATTALRELRTGLGIACEQSRFRRLYNQASA